MKSLSDYMRESDIDPHLLFGPPAPKEGWIYRDFYPMPKSMWIELLDLIGDKEIMIVTANTITTASSRKV